MSIALFLKVDGADGESKESAHKDWIDVDSFSWGIDQPSQAHTGGGLGAGKVSVHGPVDAKITVGDAIEVSTGREARGEADPLMAAIESQLHAMLGTTKAGGE